MSWRPPRPTRETTLFPYTTLFRPLPRRRLCLRRALGAAADPPGARRHDRPAALPGSAVRDDDPGAGARLDRDRPTAPRRPGRARHPVRARRTLGGRGGDRRLGRLGHVAPDRLDDLGPVEQAGALLGALQPVHDVAVLEDLRERAATVVLADDVLRHALLARRALEQEREDVLEGHVEDPTPSSRATRGWRRGSGRRADRGSGSRAPRRSAPRAPRRARAPAGRPRHAPRRRGSPASARGTAREGDGGGSP